MRLTDDYMIMFNGHEYYQRYYERKSCSKGEERKLHRAIWVETNGPIPKGCVIHHINSDVDNNNIENLQCMTVFDHNSLHHKGKKLTLDHRRNMSVASKNRKRLPHTEETKIKIGDAHRGRKATPRKKGECVCQECGEKYMTTHYTTSKYCSKRCCSRAYRKRNKELLAAQQRVYRKRKKE